MSACLELNGQCVLHPADAAGTEHVEAGARVRKGGDYQAAGGSSEERDREDGTEKTRIPHSAIWGPHSLQGLAPNHTVRGKRAKRVLITIG
jgi:hypothetical protein